MKNIIITIIGTIAMLTVVLTAIVAYEIDHLPKVYQCTKVEA